MKLDFHGVNRVAAMDVERNGLAARSLHKCMHAAVAKRWHEHASRPNGLIVRSKHTPLDTSGSVVGIPAGDEWGGGENILNRNGVVQTEMPRVDLGNLIGLKIEIRGFRC